MANENYQQKYEKVLRNGIGKAKVVGFIFGYDSQRFGMALARVQHKTDQLTVEMERKGADVSQLNARTLLSLDGELFSLGLRKLRTENGMIY